MSLTVLSETTALSQRTVLSLTEKDPVTYRKRSYHPENNPITYRERFCYLRERSCHFQRTVLSLEVEQSCRVHRTLCHLTENSFSTENVLSLKENSPDMYRERSCHRKRPVGPVTVVLSFTKISFLSHKENGPVRENGPPVTYRKRSSRRNGDFCNLPPLTLIILQCPAGRTQLTGLAVLGIHR